ncbi:MAG TPA: MmpS family transport accessory protein [Mycobacterium sp.]|nr:MmpS family transport accessory protein [Mycobacterium sp.]
MIARPRNVSSVLLGVLVGFAASWAVSPAGAAPSEEPTPSPPSTTSKYNAHPMIRYQITGVGIARRITYQTNDNQRHLTDVPLPWSTELAGEMINGANTNVYLVSAQGVGPGAISCSLAVDGKVVSQYTATGDPARVVCEHH